MHHHEINAMQPEKVFAFKTDDSAYPKLAFCARGGEWKVLEPSDKAYKETRHPVLQTMADDWHTLPIFMHAQTADRNWMQMPP